MADESPQNKREFSRVDAVIPLEVRVVPADERDTIRSVVVSETYQPETQLPPEHGDPVLAEWLKMLNSKLDALMNAFVSQGIQMGSISQRRVNISGGGLSFEAEESYDIGAILEMKLLLSTIPPSMMYIYGEVVDVRTTGDVNHIAVRYLEIDDELRDEIVKFVFKCQRDEMRRRRG